MSPEDKIQEEAERAAIERARLQLALERRLAAGVENEHRKNAAKHAEANES